MNKKDNPLTKKDFEKTLHQALADQAKSIIEAVDFGFEKAKEDRQEIKNRLNSLERRIISIEDIATEHGKDLRIIKNILTKLKKQKRVGVEKVDLLEKRIIQLEAEVA